MRSRSGHLGTGGQVVAALVLLIAGFRDARGQPAPSSTANHPLSIPPPRPFRMVEAPVRPTSAASSQPAQLSQGSNAAGQPGTSSTDSPSDTLSRLPAALPSPDRAAEISPEIPALSPNVPVDTALIPGRIIEPIDLPSALRLAGARDLDIAIARQRVSAAVADLEKARAYWLPSLFPGATWYAANGQVQTVNGPVETVNRNSLFVGALAASTAPGYPAASPGTGYPPLNGLSSVFRFSDAIYLPLAARQYVAADQARLYATNNNAMLEVAEAYLNLQLASGRIAIAREAVDNAAKLSQVTEAYARTGQGLEADHRRALTELKHRRKDVELASGQLLVASANLVRVLVLEPRIVIAPVEPAETIIRLIPDEVAVDDLIVQALQFRPELATAQDVVQATLYQWKQAKLRPFVPSLAISYAGGGLGGGQNTFFGNFGPRGDVAASLFWELQNMGFGDLAIMHRAAAEHETAKLEAIKVGTQVAADVTSAYAVRQAAIRQINEARDAVTEAIESLNLNFINIRQGAELPRATRPIEVLQPIQALAQARLDYLESVLDYNRAQFRLVRAIGRQP